jgi:hypothetical protein
MTDIRFGLLPPRFATESISDMEANDFANIIPGYSNYPATFRTIIPYLLASLVHHSQWLRENLRQDHPIFNSRVFTSGIAATLKSHVLLGSGHCSVTGITATGVPSQLLSAERLERVEQSLEVVQTGVRKCREDIMGAIDEVTVKLPRVLTDTMLQNFTVNGAVPMTRTDMEIMFQGFTNVINGKLDTAIQSLTSNLNSDTVEPNDATTGKCLI